MKNSRFTPLSGASVVGGSTVGAVLACLASGWAYWRLAYHVPRENFAETVACFALLGTSYAVLLWLKPAVYQTQALAVAFRLVWLFALPTLSDDYFRFLWDGTLAWNGQNPFLHPPEAYFSGALAEQRPQGLSVALFDRLNSPTYYTVYPPVCQLSFLLAAPAYRAGGLLGGALALRLFLLAADGLALYVLPKLLRKYSLPETGLALYALHPLAVVEGVGNLHYEPVMIAFLLASLWAMSEKRLALAGALFSLSVGAKLLSLMLLPLFLIPLGWKRAATFYAAIGGGLALQFAPFLSAEFFGNFGDSLGLYFGNFEFNASVYYVLRELGDWHLAQAAAKTLSVLTLVTVLALAFLGPKSEKAIFGKALIAFTVYLLFTRTVHPWYTLTPLALCTLTRFRYPAVWALLATLSYSAYRTSAYAEDLRLVAFEYMGLFLVMGYEVVRAFRSKRSGS